MRISDWSSDVCSSDLDDAPLAILAADLVESFGQPDLRHLRERYLPAIAAFRRKEDRKRANIVEIHARCVWNAHGDVEAPVALIEQARFAPAERCRHGVGDFLDRQAVPRNRVAIERYVEHRSPADLVGLDAARSRNALEHLHHLVRGERHLVEVVAIELDRDVAADTRNQFVERSDEHTSALQSLMRISYAVFCLK